jgi:peroxiredoxin family protein
MRPGNTEKIAIILSSGDLEKVHMAAMISSVAAVSNMEVLVLVSMAAVKKFSTRISDDERYSGGQFAPWLHRKEIPSYLELFRQARALGKVTMYVCSMAVEVQDLKFEDMEDIIDDIVGLAKFLIEAEGSQMICL